MIHPFVKSKVYHDLREMKSAKLVDPHDDVRSDEELYAAVEKNGSATIIEFDEAFIAKKPRTISPKEFEQNWRGD